jgi:hypothetical protein
MNRQESFESIELGPFRRTAATAQPGSMHQLIAKRHKSRFSLWKAGMAATIIGCILSVMLFCKYYWATTGSR